MQSMRVAAYGTLGAFLAVLVSFAGCGSSEPADERKLVARVASEWEIAVAHGDGVAACALMTEAGQKAMINPYADIVPKPKPPLGDTCEEAVAALHRRQGQQGDEPISSDVQYDVNEVRLAGDKAVIEPEDGFCSFLLKVDGSWRVAALPLPQNEDAMATDSPGCPKPSQLAALAD
jgi:hypothetical protein